MTARALSNPGCAEFPLPPSHRSFDRAVLWIALLVAAILHVAVLCLPLPEQTGIALPPQPPGPVIELTRIRIQPPPPELPAVAPATAVRRIPMPVVESPDLEPLHEPRASETAVPEVDSYPDWIRFEDTAAPPAASGPFPENTEGLVAPVGLPGRMQPEYPKTAREIRREGVVVLRAVITETGDVATIEVLRAPSPDLGFSAAAIEAVSTWKYEPGALHGRPVPVYLTVILEFTLN
jgi:protein TonB